MHKVLVVDDEAIERDAAASVLRQRMPDQLDVRTAADGVSAVEVASIWQADIALMDIAMPGMNGIHAAGRIRQLVPSCQIILLTAYGRFEYAQEAIRLGVTDYLLKPVEDDELCAAVQKALTRFADREPAPEPPKTDKNARLMQQVQRYLEVNFDEDISLESLAETLDFSPFYVSKLFRQYFGVSFIEYLTDLRVQAAKEYLADPTRSAKEVGALVGYDNSNYFAKMFKKKTGMTPTEYRNSL